MFKSALKASAKAPATPKGRAMSIVAGLGAAFGITCIVYIAYALLLTYTDLTEKYINVVVIVTTILSALVAGFDSTKGAESKGWLWGLIAGAVYVAVLLCIGAWITGSLTFGSNITTLTLISLASGGLGGMFGINMRK